MVKNLLIALVLAMMLIGCGSKTPAGKWTGSMTVDKAKMPKPRNAADQKALDDYVNQVQAAKFTLVLTDDKKFSLEDGSKTKTEGSWAQAEKQITLTPNGSGAAAKPMTLTLNDSGDSMVMVNLESALKVTLTRS